MAELRYDKYIVFNRERFESLLNNTANSHLENSFYEHAIPDAIVIRRQDKFASPCLLTYAAMITMVGDNHPDKQVREELRIIADYFHVQGMQAGEEGWKLPTP